MLTLDFSLLSAVSIFAPTIVGAFYLSKLGSKSKLIFWMVFCFTIIEVSARTFYELRVNNMFIYHIQSYFEFYFLLAIYLRLYREMRHQKIASILGVVFLVGSLLMLFRDSVYEFNAGQRYIEAFCLIVIFYIHLRELLIYDSNIAIRRNPFFWFTAGYLIYFLGTILLFLSQDMFVKAGENGYWVIHGIFNIFLNMVFTFVLWNGREKSL